MYLCGVPEMFSCSFRSPVFRVQNKYDPTVSPINFLSTIVKGRHFLTISINYDTKTNWLNKMYSLLCNIFAIDRNCIFYISNDFLRILSGKFFFLRQLRNFIYNIASSIYLQPSLIVFRITFMKLKQQWQINYYPDQFERK